MLRAEETSGRVVVLPGNPTLRTAGPVWRWLAAMIVLLIVFPGCTACREYVRNGFKVGPNYARPAAPVADDWIDAGDSSLTDQAAENAAWWRTFQDPLLDSLVDSAYRQNLSLRVAGLRILEARAERGIAAGELFPQQQQVFGAYTRIGISDNGPSAASPEHFFSDWTRGASLAWELDFWGRFRRAVEAADARLDASIENYDQVLVLLVADVAQSYNDVRIAEQRLESAVKNAEIQRKSLKLAEDRFNNGKTSLLDVKQAQANLAQTEAGIQPLEASRRRAANQLCVLLGMPPRNIDELLARHHGIPSAPPQVAVGIPAELLRRRPDLRRAEREVAAQSALIGVAASELYPHFSITGTLMFDATEFADLFDSDSLAGNVGPSFAWNILNYGRLVNNIHVQESRFQQLAVLYQDTVLRANAEAENAIVNFLKSQQQVKILEQGTQAARESVDLALAQYDGGKVDFTPVFDLQRFLTQQEDQLAVARGEVARSLIQLYKALGGGWQIRLGNPAAPPAQPPQVAAAPATTPPETEEPVPPAPLPPADQR